MSFIDLLVHEGHSIEAVSNYGLPQILAFVELIEDRYKREADAMDRARKEDDKKSNVKASYNSYAEKYGRVPKRSR